MLKYVLLNRRVKGIANVATAMTTSTPYISRSEKFVIGSAVVYSRVEVEIGEFGRY